MFHWHPKVDDYELVLCGRMRYVEAANGREHQIAVGDIIYIPAGCCVRRFVDEPSRSIAFKLPSLPGKVSCSDCHRDCGIRTQT